MGINGRNGLPQPCSKSQLILLRSLSLTARQSFLPANFGSASGLMHSGRKGMWSSREPFTAFIGYPAESACSCEKKILEVCRRLDGQRSSSCLNEVPQRLDRLSKSADIAAAAATSRLAQSDCGSAITASGVPDSTMLPRFITSISSQKTV